MHRIPFLVSLLASLLLCLSAEGRSIESKRFQLFKNGQEEVLFELSELGRISVRVQVRKPFPAIPLRLLLIAPDGTAFEREGTSPLLLERTVGDSESLGPWKVRLINISNIGGVEGRVQVHVESIEEENPPRDEGQPVSAPPTRSRAEGRQVVRPVDHREIRAACRDDNRDVAVRLDLEKDEGQLEFLDRPMAFVQLVRESDQLFRLRGDEGTLDLLLDLEEKRLYFEDSARPFCRVRLFLGDDL